MDLPLLIPKCLYRAVFFSSDSVHFIQWNLWERGSRLPCVIGRISSYTRKRRAVFSNVIKTIATTEIGDMARNVSNKGDWKWELKIERLLIEHLFIDPV